MPIYILTIFLFFLYGLEQLTYAQQESVVSDFDFDLQDTNPNVRDDFEFEFDVGEVFDQFHAERSIDDNYTEVVWSAESLLWLPYSENGINAAGVLDEEVLCQSWYYVSYQYEGSRYSRKYFAGNLIQTREMSIVDAALRALHIARQSASSLREVVGRQVKDRGHLSQFYGLRSCRKISSERWNDLDSDSTKGLLRFYFFKEKGVRQPPVMLNKEVILRLKSAHRP